MKNLSLIINGVLAVAVGILFFLHFRDCNKCCTPKSGTGASSAASTSAHTGSAIAYVDIDSLQTHYTYYLDQKAAFEKRKKTLEITLRGRAESFQNEVYEFQQKARTMSQSEGEATQAALAQKKDKLEQESEAQQSSLQNEVIKFNEELYAKLDTVLMDYNKDKKFAYIFSYMRGGSILSKDQSLDITKDVVEILNKKK